MENVYFELRNNEGYKYGMVENIPENTTEDIVRERIEVDENGETIILVEQDKDKLVDIVFDWSSLDFENGIDEEMIIVDEILEKSFERGIEDKVVYSALSIMKNDNTLSISDAIKKGLEKLS